MAQQPTTQPRLSVEEIDRFNADAWKVNRTDPRKGLELANLAFEQSIQSGYRKGEAHSLAAIGACNIWLGDYENSLSASFKAQQLLQEIQDKEKEAEVLYNLFCVFYFMADFDNALKYTDEGYKLAKEIGSYQDMAAALNGMGTVYYTTQQNEKAVEALTIGLEMARKTNDQHVESRILDGLGTAFLNLKKYEEALLYKQQCLEVAQKLNVYQVQSYALDGLGQAYAHLGEYKKSESHYEKALQLRRDMGFKVGEAETLFHLGELNFTMGSKEKALCYYEEALHIAEETDAKEVLYKTHKALADLYEQDNQPELLIQYLKSYYQIKEDFFNQRFGQKQRSLEMQLRMEQVEKEKELLEKKNQELENLNKDVMLLSEIGKKITSSLSVESINQTVYVILNTMMDAPSFGIGIYHKENNTLSFPGYLEEGKRLEGSVYDLNDMNRLACVCFNSEMEILIGDLENELQNYVPVKKAPVAGRSVTSIIYIPLKVKGKAIGVITAQSFEKYAYTNYHLNLVKNLAVYAAIALENAQLYEGLEEMVQERSAEIVRQKEEIETAYENTRLLSEIGQQITSSLHFESIFKKLYESVNQLMPAECFGVRIYHPDKNAIEYKFEIENGVLDSSGYMAPMDNENNYSVWAVKNKQVIFLNDNQNEYHKYVKEIVVPMGDMPHSLIFYPLMIEDRVLGVITVQSFKKFAYRSHHIDILRTLGSYTAIALENANLYENLEDKVKERTKEIERAHKNTQLLSEIGKEISSLLSVEEIIAKTYENINSMMDATAFGIGVYRKEENDLYFSAPMEKGQSLSDFSFKVSDDKIATRCFNNNQEIIINDWENEYRRYVSQDYTALAGDMPESMLYLPLQSKGKTIGVMTVQSFQKNAYKDYHLDMLRNLSVYIGTAIEKASLYENLEERVEERTEEIKKAYENTRLLSQIAKDISASLSVEKIIEKVYQNVNALMDAACFGIGIIDGEKGVIKMPGFIENGQRMEDFFYVISDPNRLASWCVRNQEEILISNYQEEYVKYFPNMQAPVSGTDSTSIVYLPLFSKEKIIGVLTVQSFEKYAFTEYHHNLLRNMAVSVAIAIENASLYENMEEEVKQRTAEVIKQKEVIEAKNKHIMDSIVYAKRIQQAILPPEEVFRSSFVNSFILYKPKDIVSGDFYWMEKKGNKILFAVVDCTGHGVPGAFMSIIGYNGLNQIVNEYGITEPAEILNSLNRIITSTLKQHDEESTIRDGMDLSVCCIDLENNSMQFAGANNPIFIVRKGEVIEVKADKQPIGNFVNEEEFRFTNQLITLEPQDRLYLFSDGYADQFGGPRGKKLKYNQFRDILLENHLRPMHEQKDKLEKLFEEWKGDMEQIDDVCVIGVAV